MSLLKYPEVSNLNMLGGEVSPILGCSCPERLALRTGAVLLTQVLARGAGLTGGTCVWWFAFTCSTQACAFTVAQHAGACHTGGCVHGAGTVLISPAIVTQAFATHALPSASTHSFG